MWLDGKLHFGTGAHEAEAKNIEANPRCVLTDGTNSRGNEGTAPQGIGECGLSRGLAARSRANFRRR
jgi:hypothetical protein